MREGQVSLAERRVDTKSSRQGQKNERGQCGCGFSKGGAEAGATAELRILSLLPERCKTAQGLKRE